MMTLDMLIGSGGVLSPIREATGQSVLNAALANADTRDKGWRSRVHVVNAGCGTGKSTSIAAAVATGMREFPDSFSACVVVKTILLGREIRKHPTEYRMSSVP